VAIWLVCSSLGDVCGKFNKLPLGHSWAPLNFDKNTSLLVSKLPGVIVKLLCGSTNWQTETVTYRGTTHAPNFICVTQEVLIVY
jgi:hypothetical protein